MDFKNTITNGYPETFRPSPVERILGIFTEVRPGEGATGLFLMFNIFLVLAAYYLIKPVREGWLSVSDIKGLSKVEIKAYSSFAQSLLLLGIIPIYARLASLMSRRALLTAVTLFFSANLVLFWLLHPGLLSDRIPHVGIMFYLWAGVFSVTVVAQFWSFAADLYTDERGKRLFPLIAVGASSGAVFGSWLTGQFIKTALRDAFDLILLSIVPLMAALVLTWVADKRGAEGKPPPGRSVVSRGPAAPDPTGAFHFIFKTRYLLAVAFLALLINWVNTNGENILYGTVQQTLENECANKGLTEKTEITRFLKKETTAFYGDFYFWVNLCGLLTQALLVSRLLKFGGFATILFLTPLISIFSYSVMLFFPVLLMIRVMKIAENATNYSVNNTARHVLWLPLPPSMIYKAKAAIDTLFMRVGDGMAALTVLIGVQIIHLSLKGFILLNVILVFAWGFIAFIIVRENKRLVRAASRGKITE